MEGKRLKLDKSQTFSDSSSSLEDDNIEISEVINVPLQETGLENTTGIESDSMIEDRNISPTESFCSRSKSEKVSATTMGSFNPTMRDMLDLEDSNLSTSLTSSSTSVSSLSYNSQLASEQLGPADQGLRELKLDSTQESSSESNQSPVRVSSPNTQYNLTLESLFKVQKNTSTGPKSINSSSSRMPLDSRSNSEEKQEKEIGQHNTVKQHGEDAVLVDEDTIPMDEVCDKSSSGRGCFSGVHQQIGKRKRSLEIEVPCVGPEAGFSVFGKLSSKLDIKRARNIFTDETIQETPGRGSSTDETIPETAARKSSTDETIPETAARKGSTDETIPETAARKGSTDETISETVSRKGSTEGTIRKTEAWIRSPEKWIRKTTVRRSPTLETIRETTTRRSSSQGTIRKIPTRRISEEITQEPPKRALKRTASNPSSSKSGSAKKREIQTPTESDEDSDSELPSNKKRKK